MVNVDIQVVVIDYLILSLGGETSSVYPLQKAINCIMKVEAILDRKFLKPPFKETIKPPGPGKLQGILLPFECDDNTHVFKQQIMPSYKIYIFKWK